MADEEDRQPSTSDLTSSPLSDSDAVTLDGAVVDEDQDTCRICSAPAEPDAPLFHPCKCSGTIRYIHQDCLTTWLAHSKKKTCDLCKHPYAFTKVYAVDMPGRLPFLLLFRRSLQQLFFLFLTSLRGMLVVFVWLAVLPWITIWTWRMYFAMGNSTAWWLAARPPNDTYAQNITFLLNIAAHLPPLARALGDPDAYPIFLRAASADIFTGQIIATAIVLVFIAVFLLREWIGQNARPGVWDDAQPAPAPAVPHNGNNDNQLQQQQPQQPDRRQLEEREMERELCAAVEEPIPFIQHVRAAPAAVRGHARALAAARQYVRAPARRVRPAFEKTRQRELTSVRHHTCRRRVAPADDTEATARREAHRGRKVEGGCAPDTDRLAAQGLRRRALADTALPPPVAGPSLVRPTVAPWVPESSGPSATSHPPLLTPPEERALVPPSTPPSAPPIMAGRPAPMGSPSLATYQPPEAFQARGYFDRAVLSEEADRERMEEEQALFFREPTDEEGEGEEEVGLEAEMERMEVAEGGEGEEGQVPGDALMILAEADNGEEDAEVNGEDAPGGAGADELAQLADDGDGVAEDDMEGALEAIGMRGPLFVIAQNASLMIFVLDTVIGLGIWLPFTLGKTAALLSLDPMRALYLLHLPVRLMRVVTDPIVDSVLFLLNRVLMPIVWRVLLLAQVSFVWMAASATEQLFGAATTQKFAAQDVVVLPWYERVYDSLGFLGRYFFSNAPEPTPSSISLEPVFAALERVLGPDHDFITACRMQINEFVEQWTAATARRGDVLTHLALGDGVHERIFAISLGYAISGFALLLYLYMLNMGTVKSAGRAVRSAVRQQLLIVKVIAFILIELFLFPLGCGINLDICSIWMFPETTLETRIAFFKLAPVTSIFYHWVIGTLFMYQFAILLAGSRTIMRPGAMWFIKDPSDSNFHPIRDILERPALLQLRKLLFSALMYCLVLTCGVGSIGGLMWLVCPSLLPLRWRPRDPLSDVPIDLLFMHLLLPYSLRHFRPRKYIRRMATAVWRFLACRLRLTSYMFGEDAPDEEYTPKEWRLWSGPKLVPRKEQPPFDGCYRRVPASDTVVVPRNARATAEVDIHGQAINDDELRLIAAQNVEAQLAKRNPQRDYTVVYVPPNFRWRIAAFLLALWAIGCVCVVAAFSAPILAGRQVMWLFIEREVHDGYSFFAGFYVLWLSFLVGYVMEAVYHKRAMQLESVSRVQAYAYVLKHVLILLWKLAYMLVTLGVIVPTLIALVVEVYFVLPFRFAVNPGTVPTIRIVDMWTLGLLYAKIALRSANARRQQGPIAQGIRNIREAGWLRPDPWKATVEVIGPLILGLVAMLVAPPLAAYCVIRLLRLEVGPLWSYHQVYPALFSIVSIFRSTFGLGRYLAAWTHSIRDKEYLVELKLRNFEDVKTEQEKRRQQLMQKQKAPQDQQPREDKGKGKGVAVGPATNGAHVGAEMAGPPNGAQEGHMLVLTEDETDTTLDSEDDDQGAP
ncbi:hypothetical protein K488DRAFT_56109 [Vararia minispora EC-137]|uniref:Uncharacterized protein n=1 Tax=Vararia minispora EC-137 TaxID=1314806 RepID=A0ACB8QD73_9AGAM|nr:hypothetical protein K488DRAFT_56109 [Vararia minispora EC-137]